MKTSSFIANHIYWLIYGRGLHGLELLEISFFYGQYFYYVGLFKIIKRLLRFRFFFRQLK